MMITVSSKEYYLPDFVRNCELFDTSTLTCVQCKFGASKYDGNLCCMEDDNIVNNQCVRITDEALAKELIALRRPDVNCAVYFQESCVRCKRGSIMVDSTCVHVFDAQLTCGFHKINENCAKTTKTDLLSCKCTECVPSAYLTNNVCCPLGTYWEPLTSRCEQINQPLCSKLEGTSCTECFMNPEKRLGF